MTAAGELTRRGVLAGSAAALLACTACGGGSTPTTTTTAAATTGPAAALGKVSDIPSGSGLIAAGPDGPLLLADAGGGKVVAHTAVCTHQGATINGAGICPLHGSRFDVTTGAVLLGPATAPLTAVPVTVKNGDVLPG